MTWEKSCEVIYIVVKILCSDCVWQKPV